MSDDTQTLLRLRKLTRALSEQLRGQMYDYLATLTPLFRPKAVLGDYVHGAVKESGKKADKAFKDLQGLWESIVAAKPFTALPREIAPPLDVGGLTLEVHPVEYTHKAVNGDDSRMVTIRTPLKWVLTYAGFGPARLTELLGQRNRTTDELQRAVLHYLTLHVVLTNQPGLGQLLEALHFPASTERIEAFGPLPITCISAAVSTRRPADPVLIQSAEISGMDAFEEVVVVEDIPKLTDLTRERMLQVVRTQAPDLLPGLTGEAASAER
jgi:hypothetical protein